MNKNHTKNILIYDIWYKILIGSKPLRIRLNKIDRILEFMTELDI